MSDVVRSAGVSSGAAASPLALSMDIGTSSIKAALVDVEHGVVAQRAVPLPYVAENVVDAQAVWDASAGLIADLLHGGLASRIAGVVLSGQGDGLWGVGVDGRGTLSYTWNSTFAADVVADWERTGVVDQLYRITGTVIWPGTSAALWRWLKAEHPERAAAIRTVFCAKDFVGYCLTGVEATDYSDGTIPFTDPHTAELSPEVFALLGCEDLRARIPRVAHAGELLGRVTAEASAASGLKAGTPVYVGAIDCVASVRGAGVSEEHQAVVSLGTTTAAFVLTHDPVPIPEPVGASLVWPDAAVADTGDSADAAGPALTLRVLGSSSGAKVLEWFLDRHGYAGDGKYDRFWADVEAAGDGHGEIMLPFLYGERVPFLSPAATGAFVGIVPATTIGDLGRAVVEGIAFSLRHCLESCGEVRDVVLTGGGTGDDRFSQLIADVLGRSVAVDTDPQIGVTGIAAYVPGFESLARRAGHIRRFEPAGDRVSALERRYRRYRALIDALLPIWNQTE